METKIKSSSVEAINTRIDPSEPEQYITVPFEYYLSDTAYDDKGTLAFVLTFTNPYSDKPEKIIAPTLLNFEATDENIEEGAKYNTKEYLEFHANL